MEDSIVTILTQWGPLALGWPIAWFFFRQSNNMVDKNIEISIKVTDAMNRVSTANEIMAKDITKILSRLP